MLKKRGDKTDNFSSCRIILTPSSPELSYEQCSFIIDTYNTHLSPTLMGNFELDNQLNPSKEAQAWIHFISFNLFNVNSLNDYSIALIMGISPDIYGRHHVTKAWILKKLFEITQVGR